MSNRDRPDKKIPLPLAFAILTCVFIVSVLFAGVLIWRDATQRRIRAEHIDRVDTIALAQFDALFNQSLPPDDLKSIEAMWRQPDERIVSVRLVRIEGKHWPDDIIELWFRSDSHLFGGKFKRVLIHGVAGEWWRDTKLMIDVKKRMATLAWEHVDQSRKSYDVLHNTRFFENQSRPELRN